MTDETLVLVVGADPKPHDVVAFENAKRAIVDADADRIDGAGRMYRLETEARMIGVGPEQLVRALSLRANRGRERLARLAEGTGSTRPHLSLGSSS